MQIMQDYHRFNDASAKVWVFDLADFTILKFPHPVPILCEFSLLYSYTQFNTCHCINVTFVPGTDIYNCFYNSSAVVHMYSW